MADKRHVDLLQQGFMKPKRRKPVKLKLQWACDFGHTHDSRKERDGCDLRNRALSREARND